MLNMKQSNKAKLSLQNGVLVRNVDSAKHYFVKHRAYAFDLDVLRAYKGKFHTLKIITTYGKVYTIPAKDVERKGIINNDYGKPQLLIKVSDFRCEAKQHTKTIHLDIETHQEIVKQAKSQNVRIMDIIKRNILLKKP